LQYLNQSGNRGGVWSLETPRQRGDAANML